VEIVVKVTQNWSLEAKIMFADTVKIGARMVKIGAQFCVLLFFRNVFLGQIWYNSMGVSFTINIGIVSV